METHQQATGHADASLYDYDVFLSFRGPDTRTSFTDVLYDHLSRAGLRIFRDDDELKLGDMINKILPAIDNSRLCIPLFSKTFAESKWCLWEVTRMVELQKHILPIFYDVTVEDVNLKTPVYNKFMPDHVMKSGENEVEKWKEALKTISALDGKQVLDTRCTAFCESFVKELLITLKSRRKIEIDPPIGLEDQIQRLMQLLDIHSTGVRYIGIYGMGGIGKTTLATDIFNKIADQFDGSSFLEDIRESSGRHESCGRHGMTCLLEKLLNSLNIPTPVRELEHLSGQMEECFRKKKILIVLDDVDQWEQIRKLAGKSRWFGSGSRIIVTSRDKRVMETGEGKLSEDEVGNIEMEPLGRDNALQLFNRHAFKEGTPTDGFEELSKKAASLTGGLPLALKIIGSLLFNRRREIWKEVIEKLNEIPESDVKKRLKISYDALSDEQKYIYLDIACFFVGSSITYPIYMWKDCKFSPSSGLGILCSMSLVKISNDGIISMHDQLRDLGRDIIREEDMKIPANRSRLWEDETARRVLKTKKDKKNVEALRIEGDCVIDLTQVEIGSLENLRYLDLQRANLQGDDFEDLFPNLIWLSYHCHENLQATTFAMPNLVILDLSCSTIDEKWRGWSQLKNAKNLKVLDLREAEYLTRTPYFPEGMTLEQLILNGCSKLVAIDGSIGHLKRLKFLSLERCNSLTGLPKEVVYLEHLEYIVGGYSYFSPLKEFENLDLRERSSIMDMSEGGRSKNQRNGIPGRYKIRSLPISFGNLVKLKFLSLAYLPIMELPESFGELKSLLVLDLDFTKISKLPDSIEGFVKLEKLSLHGCEKLEYLPPTLGALKSLVTLHLTHAALVELPSSIGELAGLKQLLLSYCSNMKKLPDSLGNITSLIELDLSFTGVLELPDSIGKLENLEDLRLSDCSNIMALPGTIGDLKRLLLLDLSGTEITELPESIGGLKNLRKISLARCPLKTLPKSFGALKKLEELNAQSANLSGDLPSEISGLSSLTFLDLSRTQVCELPSSINQLHRLHDLDLNECNQLRELPDLPTNLTNLVVSSTDTTLPDEFGNLTRLKKLGLVCPSLRSVPRLPLSLEEMHLVNVEQDLDLPNLPYLKTLSILAVRAVSYIRRLRLSLPESLRELYVIDSPTLESWPDISHLKNLRNLHVAKCQRLTEIPGLGKLKSLRYLVIERCPSLKKLENLSELEQIECVCIDSCTKLGYPEGVDSSKVRILGGDFQEISEAIANEQHDIYSLLSSPGRDFLIRSNGHQVKVDYLKGKKVCLYFHQSSWGTFDFVLYVICEYMYSRGVGELMVVYVPYVSHDEEYFNKGLFFTNWLAVPFSDEDKRRRLNMLFQGHRSNTPQLCIFDESGRLLTSKGFEIIGSYGADAYPFTPKRVQMLKLMNEEIRRNQSIESIFSVPSTEFVLTFDGRKLPVSELGGKIVGIYFSSSSDERTGFTSMLHEVYKELKANGESFEIVWAPIRYPLSSYIQIFSMLPYSTALIWSVVCFRRYFYFSVGALPTLVIIDEDGKTLHPNVAQAIKEYGAKAYPFTPEKIEKAKKEECERLVVSACREFVITNRGEHVDGSTLAGKNILLYFSDWCSYCCAFLPKLMEAYDEIKARDDAFEVIFTSIDMDEASFRKCFSSMPWLALPFRDERIRALYSGLEVTEVPTLVAIGPTYRIITKDVRDLIIAYGSDAYPFTNEHISNMVNNWPHKLEHDLHAHELALTERHYICDACNNQQVMRVWSYYCKECSFDLHPKCALKGGRWESPEQSEPW